MTIKLRFLLLFFSLFFESCFKKNKENIQKDGKKTFIQSLKKYDRVNFYDKIFAFPKEMIPFLKKHPKHHIYADILNHQNIKRSEIKLFKDVLKEIPLFFKKKIEEKLLAIFLVKGIGSSGFTELLPNEKGVIFLNVEKLNRKSNKWCRHKESSPFDEGKIKIVCQMDTNFKTASHNAILYTLLHELAHLLEIKTPFLPTISSKKNLKTFPFTKLSWEGSPYHFSALTDKTFYLRPSLKFFNLRPKLKNYFIPLVYKQFLGSNFVTLYGSINYVEDFAESIAHYIYVNKMKKPYKITIQKENRVLLIIKPCWEEDRCKKKKEIIEKILFSK
jgi:hypothetical protein